MKIFDFNIHLAGDIEKEKQLNYKDLKKIYQENLNLYKKSFTACNFMLFNEHLSLEDVASFKELVKKDFTDATLTLLYDFQKKRDLKSLKSAGIEYIKFHSYVQKIGEEFFKEIAKISKEAEKAGLGILIDTSYGSLGIYDYDNLRLAVEVAKEVKIAPIVLLHSAGARATEAMTFALAAENIYFETSFSLPFYMGSTIEKDLSFAYKQLKKRVVYGSDYPYVAMEESLKKTEDFFTRNNFSKEERQEIYKGL